jgi:hypothetical protein
LISDITPRTIQNCNGVLKNFTFTFPIISSSDLVVTLTNTTTGAETTLAETTDYTVADPNGVMSSRADYSSGGSITTTAADAYSASYTITIERSIPYTQEVDLTEAMPTLYETFEDGLDKVTMLVQQVRDMGTRSIRVPASELTDMLLPDAASRANMVLGFDADGDAIPVVPAEQGEQGIQGDKGDKGDTGAQVMAVEWDVTDMKFTNSDWTTFKLLNAMTTLKGLKGDTGSTGATGAGVPEGGTARQVLKKKSATNFDTEWGVGGGSATKDITQAGHSFSVGDVLKFASGVYSKAQADTAANSEVVGIVSEVLGTDDFTLLNVGYISGLSGLTAGTLYFLSDSVAGALTATEPTTAGYISKPLLIAASTTVGYFFNMRGVTIQSTTTLAMASIIADSLKLNLTGHVDGDTWYESSGAFTRLAKGAANTKKYMNAAGTAPEWSAGVYSVRATKDISTTGDVSHTGVGFKPSSIICFSGTPVVAQQCVGFTTGVSNQYAQAFVPTSGVWQHYPSSFILLYLTSSSNNAVGVLKSFDTDGFTITWSKTGSPTGTADLYFLCFR